MNIKEKYPPLLIGPIQYYDESLLEDLLEDLIIDGKPYKHDKYANVTGYINCVLAHDSNCDLEKIGILDTVNNIIIDYQFEYSYNK